MFSQFTVLHINCFSSVIGSGILAVTAVVSSKVKFAVLETCARITYAVLYLCTANFAYSFTPLSSNLIVFEVTIPSPVLRLISLLNTDSAIVFVRERASISRRKTGKFSFCVASILSVVQFMETTTAVIIDSTMKATNTVIKIAMPRCRLSYIFNGAKNVNLTLSCL